MAQSIFGVVVSVVKTFIRKSERKLMAVAPELSLTYLNNQTLKDF